MNLRHLLLAAAACASVWLAFAAPDPDPVAPLQNAVTIVRQPRYSTWSELQAELAVAQRAKPAANVMFQPPPPPPPVVVARPVLVSTLPPPPPLPPALPFRFLGRISDDAGVRVFLQHKDDLFYASAGQKISLDYQVVDISQHAITFLYLPLNIQQELRINE